MKGVFDLFCNVDKSEGTGILKWNSNEEENNCFKMNFQAAMGILMDNNLKDDKLCTDVIPCLEILPFICCKSPIVAMIQYNNKNPNTLLITTTIKSIEVLFQVKKYLFAIIFDMRQKNDKNWEKLHKFLTNEEGLKKYLINFEKDLQIFFEKVKQHQISTSHAMFKNCMNDFGNMMKKYTFQRIHLYEKQIFNCLLELSKTPEQLEFRCTPIDNIPNNLKFKANAALDVINFFKLKQDFITTHEGTMFLNYGQIEEKIKLNKNLFDNLIPYETLWEYAKLLDKNNLINK
jgi:hypothetical protein